jgi:hypothetical protein
MLASLPVSMLNQKPSDLGIPNRFKLDPSRSRGAYQYLRAAHSADDMLRIARNTRATWVLRRKVAPPGREETTGSIGRYTGKSQLEKMMYFQMDRQGDDSAPGHHCFNRYRDLYILLRYTSFGARKRDRGMPGKRLTKIALAKL